ncbi:amidohydrolase [Williamsia sterculiae]|uniref:Amidohydrolase 3 domain-containing protein n=1 Tax=Williamsia sterculiae TaxID=1344003 RepID=A0A1N7ENT0_9NOCA|nr:amidohydrolase family protein [Williamsia sterculiae]SIR89748.1 hypothetical protein SAMN05445060_1508 [Williamsia sterculiae]
MTTQLLLGGQVYSHDVPDATAMAVTDGVVAWVGVDHVGRSLHPGAEVIDLDGAFVAPAFVDTHVHLTSSGLSLGGLDLSEATSATDCLDRLRTHAAQSDDDIIWGLGWDSSAWADPTEFTTSDVDAAVGRRAVYLARIDEHSAVVSSALRALAHDVDEAPGFDAEGALTAEAHHRVRGAARTLLRGRQRERAQRRALDFAAAHGVVAVHENGGPDISGLDDLLALSDLGHPVHIRRYWGQAATDADEVASLIATTGADGLAGDLFIDGAIGSHTAWLTAPYDDDPTMTGVAYMDSDAVYAHLRSCTAAGVQAGFHMIGDAATACVVGALRRLVDEFGGPAVARCGHRLEHVEMTDAGDAAVFAAAGVIASMQPLFDALWGGPGQLYAQRLGVDRGSRLNDFATLARAGVGLAFSSDSPVTPIDPWSTVRAAVHHNNPVSAVSARAAFTACTRGAWRAGGVRDGLTGTLTPGAPAHYAVWDADDLVVAGSSDDVQRWSTDPRSRVPALPDVAPGGRLPRCLRTVRDGRTIYDAAAGVVEADA